MGRRADPPATGRGASAPWSRGRRPGRPNRAAPRSSTGSRRACGRRGRNSATGRPRRSARTSRGKSSGPPGVGSAHTSSSRKSRVSSWIRQGREVCAVFGSLIVDLIQTHQPNPTTATARALLDQVACPPRDSHARTGTRSAPEVCPGCCTRRATAARGGGQGSTSDLPLVKSGHRLRRLGAPPRISTGSTSEEDSGDGDTPRMRPRWRG